MKKTGGYLVCKTEGAREKLEGMLGKIRRYGGKN